MDAPLDRDDVMAIMGALFDVRRVSYSILYYLLGDDDGQEDEEEDSP